MKSDRITNLGRSQIFVLLTLGAGFGGCAPSAMFQISFQGGGASVPLDAQPLDVGDSGSSASFDSASYDPAWMLHDDRVSRFLSTTTKRDEIVLSIAHEIEKKNIEYARRLMADVWNVVFERQREHQVLLVQVVSLTEQQFRTHLAAQIATKSYKKARYKKRVEYEKDKAQNAGVTVAPSRSLIAEMIPEGFGPALGSLLGWMAMVGDEEDELVRLPDETALRQQAGLEIGLGEDPEQGLIELNTKLAAKLVESEITACESMTLAYEQMLRRSLFKSEDGVLLARALTKCLAGSQELLELAESIWDTTEQDYLGIAELHKRFEGAHKRAQNAFELSLVVVGLLESFQHYPGPKATQYQASLIEQGVELGMAQEIHTIPTHAMDYNVLLASLGQAWADETVFRACLLEPEKFRQSVAMTYPGMATTR